MGSGSPPWCSTPTAASTGRLMIFEPYILRQHAPHCQHHPRRPYEDLNYAALRGDAVGRPLTGSGWREHSCGGVRGRPSTLPPACHSGREMESPFAPHSVPSRTRAGGGTARLPPGGPVYDLLRLADDGVGESINAFRRDNHHHHHGSCYHYGFPRGPAPVVDRAANGHQAYQRGDREGGDDSAHEDPGATWIKQESGDPVRHWTRF